MIKKVFIEKMNEFIENLWKFILNIIVVISYHAVVNQILDAGLNESLLHVSVGCYLRNVVVAVHERQKLETKHLYS